MLRLHNTKQLIKNLILQKEILSRSLLFDVFNRVRFVDARSEIVWVSPESYSQQLEEPVHASQESLRGVGYRADRRLAFKHYHTICQIRRHDEIVLNHKTSFLRV